MTTGWTNLVTLSNYLLMFECCFFVWGLSGAKNNLAGIWIFFFGLIALNNFLAGTTHIFFGEKPKLELLSDVAQKKYIILWSLILTTTAIANSVVWLISATLLRSNRWQSIFRQIALWQLILCGIAQIVYFPLFRVVAIFTLVATCTLLGVLIGNYCSRRQHYFFYGIWGLVCILLGYYVFLAGINLPSPYLTTNTLYHLISAFGLIFVYFFAREQMREDIA